MALEPLEARKLHSVTAKLFSRRRRGDGAHSTQFAATIVGMPDVDVSDAPSSHADTPNPDSIVITDGSGVNAAVPDVVTDIGGLLDEAPDPADAPTLSHIGRYALKRELGSGGLGSVFEAWDPLLSRVVAVKTLQFDIEQSARVSLDGLFLNEARAAAGLNHRYIVTIHDAGLSAHGVYIAMERLYGRDLQHALAGGWRPSVEQAMQLVRRINEALAYAHARGVVHCDIKPANIFLQRRDKPKVLDFGIARIVHGAALPALDGAVTGSPRYRAPEQLTGAAVDVRTDLYSLGVVMYELLTGRRAFTGDSLAEINTAVLEHEPTPVHEVDPSIPRDVSAIVTRLMARAPADRYTCATELSADLRRWMHAHQAPPAGHDPPPAAPAAVTRKASTARWLVGAGLLVGAAALAAGLMAVSAPPVPAPAAAAPPAAAPALVDKAAGEAAAAPIAIPSAAVVTDPPPAQAPGESAAIAAVAPAASLPAAAAVKAATPAAARLRPAVEPSPRSRQAAVADVARRESTTEPQATSGPAATEAPALGSVHFAISPWGEVEVNGKPSGTTPPLARLNPPEGTQTITVRNADFAPHTVQVQVTADKPVTLRHRFGS